jgi:hypothetical protein
MATNGPAAGVLASYQMFIGGKWVDASRDPFKLG